MLPIAMLTGASSYLLYHVMPEPIHRIGPALSSSVSALQPSLIFAMLFLTFCRIEPKDLKPHRWHWWLLLIQGGLFVLLGFAAWTLIRHVPSESHNWVVIIESAMLCLICPTATAAAVVTRKLGGDIPGITTYIVLINILTAVLVPLMVPMIQPSSDSDFWTSFSMIMAKVFPLLISPCLCAWLVRYLAPVLHARLLKYPDLPFYLWAVGLTLAIAVTTKAIVHSEMSISLILAMSVVSLLCCAFQFATGRYVGSRYRPRRRSQQSDCRNSDVCVAHSITAFHAARCESPQDCLPAAHDPVFCAEGGTVFVFRSQTAEERGREVRKVTAGQAMGQKNTIFAIWLAYTFMTPETAIVGGLYSIWHNIYNSWQLRRAMRDDL